MNTPPYATLYLDPDAWDLTVDASGDIAVANPPYAVAQDVASVCRTFLGEVYYDSSLGIPYLQSIFGKAPPLNVLQSAMVTAALTVPTVEEATCVVSAFSNRLVTGQIQFETTGGGSGSVTIGTPQGTSYIETESGQVLEGEGGGGIEMG